MGLFRRSTAFSEGHRMVVWMEEAVQDAQGAVFYGETLHGAYRYQGGSSPEACSCS